MGRVRRLLCRVITRAEGTSKASGFKHSRAKLVSTLLSRCKHEPSQDCFCAITRKVGFDAAFTLYARRPSQDCFCNFTRKVSFNTVFMLSREKHHTAQATFSSAEELPLNAMLKPPQQQHHNGRVGRWQV